MDRGRVWFAALAGLSCVALAVVTVAVTSTWLRLLLSLGAVLPGYGGAVLLWHTAGGRRRSATQPRRFNKLRSTTDRFLEEVRRLNSVRVQIYTGQQSPLQARPELAEIEARMARLIDEMREAAGQVTSASVVPPSDPPGR